MTDILVSLYKLEQTPKEIDGIAIRRPLPHEKGPLKRWIAAKFGEGWGDEFECSFKALPVTSFVALKGNRIVGFACYDVASRGFFGPTGVLESERGKGIGTELLFRSLIGLRELGYAYAIIGGAGPVEYYLKILDAFPIPGSSPGIYPGKISVD